MYIFCKKRNWAYDIRQKFHASYVTVSLSDINTTFTAYVLKPENIYQKENNQRRHDIYILLYWKSKSSAPKDSTCVLFIKYLIYFFVFFQIFACLEYLYFLAYSFLILKSPFVSSKTTLVGNLHYREKGEQTDSTRDIDQVPSITFTITIWELNYEWDPLYSNMKREKRLMVIFHFP